MEAKEQICVRLKKEDLADLRKLSEEHELPVAWFINQAIKKYLEPTRIK